MLRYTDETCAAVWVETDADAEVSVHVGDSEWRSRAFAVHGHHYALVEIEDLAPGSVLPYEVRVNAETVWPDPDSRCRHQSSPRAHRSGTSAWRGDRVAREWITTRPETAPTASTRCGPSRWRSARTRLCGRTSSS